VKWQVIVGGALLLFALTLPGATAAAVTLTADQTDYYFPAGQRVEIPISVMSTFSEEIPGTARFSTDTQFQKTGTVMISTENRVFTHAVPAGRSFLNLTLPPSPVSRDYKVHVSYYYTSPSPVNASLPEFYIHIVTDPGLVKNTPAPLTGTGVPESGKIPAESSVSMVEQAVSVREQMGSDSSNGQSVAGGQSPAGTAAEREQQQRDREEREREQAELDSRLARDPLVIAVNASLAAEGFSRQSMDTQPAAGDTGTFSMLYRRGAEGRVIVQGTMAAGIVPSVRELANVPIIADPALDANATYRSFTRTLAGQEYGHKETTVNRTLTGAVANSTYALAGGNKAYVNATTVENTVIQISLEQERGPSSFPQVPILIVVVVVLAVSGWYLYRRYRQHGDATPDAGKVTLPAAFDHRAEAERILGEAGLAYARQDYAHAYGLTGRALRVFLSYEYGDNGEVTTAEIITLLHKAGRDTAEVETVLGQCGSVAFARGTPDEKEFSQVLGRVREIIRAQDVFFARQETSMNHPGQTPAMKIGK
jgi:hypothetical protein